MPGAAAAATTGVAAGAAAGSAGGVACGAAAGRADADAAATGGAWGEIAAIETPSEMGLLPTDMPGACAASCGAGAACDGCNFACEGCGFACEGRNVGAGELGFPLGRGVGCSKWGAGFCGGVS